MVIDRLGESLCVLTCLSPGGNTNGHWRAYARTLCRLENFVRNDVGTQHKSRQGGMVGEWRDMFLGHVLCGTVVGLEEV